MSFQAQPQQQPAQVYPTSVTNQPPSDHSNGSFGTVFIVLAVIIVISAVACFLGRLCNRRHHGQSQSHSHSHGPGPSHSQKPVNQAHLFRPKEADVELGLDKRMPSVKSNGFRIGHGHGHGYGPENGFGLGGGGGRGPSPKPPMNSGGGDMKAFEMKVGDRRGNLRAIA